jgi:hypothetical protein
MLIEVLLVAVGVLWLGGALLVWALCLASRRGDGQRVIADREVQASRGSVAQTPGELLTAS